MYDNVGTNYRCTSMYDNVGTTYRCICMYDNVGTTYRYTSMYDNVGTTYRCTCMYDNVWTTYRCTCMYDIACFHDTMFITVMLSRRFYSYAWQSTWPMCQWVILWSRFQDEGINIAFFVQWIIMLEKKLWMFSESSRQ